MKNIIIVTLTILTLSISLKAEDDNIKIDHKKLHSIYFTTSDGRLFHSDDFGITYNEVKEYQNRKIEESIKESNILKFMRLQDQLINFEIDDKNIQNIKIITSDILGNSKTFDINIKSEREQIFLDKKYKQLFVKVITDNKEVQTFNLINN